MHSPEPAVVFLLVPLEFFLFFLESRSRETVAALLAAAV